MSPPTETPDVASRGAANAEKGAQLGAFSEALAALGELKAYVGYYISTRVDQIKLTLRSVVIWAALGVVGLLALVTLVVMAVVQVLSGIAGGISQLIPSLPWLGPLITGIAVLALAVLGVWWGVRFIGRASRAAIVAKYESMKQEQRQQFGHSVSER